MPICVVVPNETVPGERRVALVPNVAEQLSKQGLDVRIEAAAGAAAFYRDSDYNTAQLIDDRADLFAAADVLLTIPGLLFLVVVSVIWRRSARIETQTANQGSDGAWRKRWVRETRTESIRFRS